MPKKPVGKNINTITKVVKAAMSLYSIEIYPDQKVSISPINKPPSIVLSDVFPALPVTAINLAEESSRFFCEKSCKKLSVFFQILKRDEKKSKDCFLL